MWWSLAVNYYLGWMIFVHNRINFSIDFPFTHFLAFLNTPYILCLLFSNSSNFLASSCRGRRKLRNSGNRKNIERGKENNQRQCPVTWTLPASRRVKQSRGGRPVKSAATSATWLSSAETSSPSTKTGKWCWTCRRPALSQKTTAQRLFNNGRSKTKRRTRKRIVRGKGVEEWSKSCNIVVVIFLSWRKKVA